MRHTGCGHRLVMNEWGNAKCSADKGIVLFSCSQEPVLCGVQVDLHWT